MPTSVRLLQEVIFTDPSSQKRLAMSERQEKKGFLLKQTQRFV